MYHGPWFFSWKMGVKVALFLPCKMGLGFQWFLCVKPWAQQLLLMAWTVPWGPNSACILSKNARFQRNFARKPFLAPSLDSQRRSFHFLWLLEEKFGYITSVFWIPHTLPQSSDFNSRNFRHCGIHSVINFTYKTFIEVFMIWFVLNQPILPPPPPLLCLKQNKWPSIIWHSSDINHNPHWITFKSTLWSYRKV